MRLHIVNCVDVVYEILTPNIYEMSPASSGHDNISNILLKEIIDSIAPALSIVFNKCMVVGEFPNIMKLAEIVPLYKGKEHYLEMNYRPISLLTTMSKVLEKIVYQRVYTFLQETGQLYENQFGFRESHSCEHAVGQVINGIIILEYSGIALRCKFTVYAEGRN